MSSGVENERRIDELRSLIDNVLVETDAYKKIKAALASASSTSSSTSLSALNARVTERQMLAQLVTAVKQAPIPELLTGDDGAPGVVKLGARDDPVSGQRNDGIGEVGVLGSGALALRVEILGGAAFVGELVDSSAKGQAFACRTHLGFRKQRGVTAPAASGVEPAMRGVFLFELAARAPAKAAEWYDVLAGVASSVRFCITRERVGAQASSRRELVAVGAADWRDALLSRGAEVSLALKACGPDSVVADHQATAGDAVLRVSMEVVALDNKAASSSPSSSAKPSADAEETTPLDDVSVRRQVQRQGTLHAEASRRFYLHARQWWADYAGLGPGFGERNVKLFARDEVHDLRCACSFVAPILAARALDSPRHAARFVSLLPLEKQPAVGGAATDTWHSPLAIVAKRAGDVADHATLLCSLLLGFGLEAYVAVGHMPDGQGRPQPHLWVVTYNRDAASSRQRAGFRCEAWESCTGKRCFLEPLEAEAARRYASVACVFNHERFYANRQASDLVRQSSWDLEDTRAWKPLDPASIKALLEASQTAAACRDFALAPTRVDVSAAELKLEADLRSLVTASRRAELGLLTHWDAELSYLLQPALANYEAERVLATHQADDHFETAIRRAVPNGHCFKGFPTSFSHAHAARIFAALQRAELALDVLSTAGDHVRHAIRVKMFPYAEDVSAVWVMIAVRYLKPTHVSHATSPR